MISPSGKLDKIKMSRYFTNAAHRFMRNPNVESTIFKRAWSKSSPFENTLTVLEDPNTGRKVYLIGTTNSSTTLAKRTETLINEVKPENVFVQTSSLWYERAKNLEVHNQQQFNSLNPMFNDIMLYRAKYYPNHIRGLYFKMRFYGWLYFMNYYLSFPSDFNPWRPGVEILWGIKAAEKVGAKVTYTGGFINRHVVNKMSRENNLSFLRAFLAILRGEPHSRWRTETLDFWNLMRTTGGAAFAENLDRSYLGWFVSWFERKQPEVKKILVDSEDERIFHLINNSSSKVTVAIVNHWHLPGIENMWKSATGTHAKTTPINPIGDMNVDEIMETNLANDLLRAEFSRRSKTEPAAWANYLTHYKKSVMEPERERHVFFDGAQDHHMDHGLFNGENQHAAGAHHHDHQAHHQDHAAIPESANTHQEPDAPRKGKKGKRN